MACFSRFIAAFGLCTLQVLPHASWAPRPFADYETDLPAEGSPLGLRRFRHREVHEFDDGSDLELQWEVDADPESILSLDLEHPRGVRVQECTRDALTLHARREHVAAAARWRHVSASDDLHGCGHLAGEHLYRRIVRVEGVGNHSRLPGVAVIRLATEELASPSQVFPHCRYYFSIVPVQAKDPEDRARSLAARRLKASFGSGNPFVTNHFTPQGNGNSHKSLLNFHLPSQLSNLGYNWDYAANTTLNPQFKYNFPGGVGFVRLYQPYLKAHFSLNINHTSKISSVRKAPHVKVVAELKGHSDFNLDLATAVNFKDGKSAGVLKDVLRSLDIPGLSSTSSHGGGSGSGGSAGKPIKFYFGPVPFTVKPGFSCKLKAYHIGFLKGSLRVGLASKMVMKGVMSFDSQVGVQTNITARAEDINFTAPTWMIFTQHFELGMMLEPMFSLKGGFGDMRDMEIGFAVRPYFNLSILQTNPAALGGDTSARAELAVYPFRAVGLPAGGNYAVKVAVNGQKKRTATKYSTGVVEFNDDINGFTFGTISRDDLLMEPIEVSILKDGKGPPVATGNAVCSTVVNGICKPSPVTATMQVDGKAVYVHMSVVWHDNSLSILKSKMKSVSLRFPSVSVSPDIAQQLSSKPAMDSVELRVTRNGRTYSVPLSQKGDSPDELRSRVIYDLGPCFLGAWKSGASFGADKATQDLLTPKLDLLVGGSVVGTGSLPASVSWDKPTNVDSLSKLASNIQQQLKSIPVTVPLYPPGGGTSVVGTGVVEIAVLPAQLSAFWVFPHQEEELVAGRPYTLRWTLANGKEGRPVKFTLTAMEVGQDGSLTPTSWQQSLSASCTVNASLPVDRYDGGVTPCVYSHAAALPSSLAGRQVVVVASWLGRSYLSPHWMVSTPVHVSSSSGRPSDSQENGNKGAWGRTSLGAVNHTGFGQRVKDKLHRLSLHCSPKPLQYRINAGMNYVEHMKNMVLPTGGSLLGGFSERPDWTSKPKPLMKPLGSGRGGGHLKSLLPKILCTGGACEGMMPGCNRTKAVNEFVKQLRVDLSRNFLWKTHKQFGPKLRYSIAYALALAPSMLQLGQSEASPRRLQATVAGSASEAGTAASQGPTARAAAAAAPWPLPGELEAARWPHDVEEGSFEVEDPNAEDDGEDEELRGTEFHSFVVRITEPIHYELTEELLNTFLRRGAFRSVSDGREQTHGPVEVVSLKLLRPPSPPLAAREALYEVPRGPPLPPPLAGPHSRIGWTWRAAAASAACLLPLGAALAVAARAAARRRGYAPVGRADSPSRADSPGMDARLFA